MFKTVKIKEKEYKLRLTAKGCVELEKQLGINPLNILVATDASGIPLLSNLLMVFHEALVPYQHDITLDKAYDLYDDYLEDGGNIMTFMNLIVDVFKDAGFIPPEAENTKNA